MNIVNLINTNRVRDHLRSAFKHSAIAVAVAVIASSGTAWATRIYNFTGGTGNVSGYYPGGDNGQYTAGAEGFTPSVSGSWSGWLDTFYGPPLYFSNNTRFTLTADPGKTVTLLGFDVGRYYASGQSSFTILDSDDNVLATVSGVETGSMSSFGWPVLKDTKLTIVFGTTEHDNHSINNITFSEQDIPVASITGFGPGATVGELVGNAANITWTVPSGTNVTALAPTFTLSSGGCDKTSGSTHDFSSPVEYTVTDGLVVNTYTVTVVVSPWGFSAWTGDADSGIIGASPYTAAVNCNGDETTVNGVTFEASTLTGANFSIGGGVNQTSGSPNITGDSLALASGFIFDGFPRTVTLTNLAIGATYETSLFAFGWEASGRRQVFASGSDRLVIDQDLYGGNQGIRIAYTFVATATTKVLTVTPIDGGSFHMSALANREVSPPPPAVIYSFGPGATVGALVGNAANITWTVPSGTDVTALAPTFTLSTLTGTCDKDNGGPTTYDFTSPVDYTVTDGATVNVYTVTVVVSPWGFSPWTGDGDSGIIGASPYTVAVNFGGASTTVNEVDFEASTLSGPNFSIGGGVFNFTGGAPAISGASLALASDFIYNGTPRTVTLTNLTEGETYETSLFAYGYDGDSSRSQIFASGSDSLEIDQNVYGVGQGIRITYTFVADATTKVLTITPVSDRTFHMSALANRQVSNSTDYSTWASANAPGQTPDQDHDNDGVDNGIEYFMGESGSSFTAMPGLDGTNTVTWTKDPAYQGTWQVQTSPDLSAWTNVTGTDNGTSVSYILPSGLGKRFVRLLVTPTP